ncbi:MAG: EAL domain-containing protein, partial [Candidatus Thiodiazotropha sp.]
ALQGSSIAHYQTLLRLQEPDGNLYTAGEFIPIAEELKMIAEIDQWVTRQAINLVNENLKKGTHLHLFVSQSINLLDNMERLSWLSKKHSAGHLFKNTLTFEFNIHEVGRNLKTAKICFEMLNKLSISCLLTRVTMTPETEQIIHHLPIRFIKLDYSLLNNPGEDVQQLIELAHSRNIKAIAPQVEDPRSLAVLWSSGIDYVQGNFVQRPESNLIYDFNESVL